MSNFFFYKQYLPIIEEPRDSLCRNFDRTQ